MNEFINGLVTICKNEIEKLGVIKASKMLSVDPSELLSLTRRENWSLDDVFNVADRLKLAIEIGVKSPSGQYRVFDR